ncbi:SLAP domain-containing protein [Brevibacillus sp. AY1]|uniref:SLAP domain-containing protein n=1 Tax=Brevibacillus sp. AY1 TaxID=2807621 RepID=UPI002455A843|nr:SLAP domain-containing protein [Brevibacillus sp. AY1]MDH4619232.1 SLAP domain-containing protein [Brevibacillus sp. AY1]
MFSFFKNWLSKDHGDSRSIEDLKKDIQEESAVDVEELRNTEAEFEAADEKPASSPSNMIRTDLSLHPNWEKQLDSEKKYTLRFLQAELPEMRRGMISVTGFSMVPQKNGMTVALFFRNATDRPVRIKNIRLAIYLDDKPFARMPVNLEEMGAIPPHTSRPWEVLFPEETYLHENYSFTRWKVVMKAGNSTHVWPTTLELDPEMERRMTTRQKDRLEAMVHTLPPIPVNSIEITGFDIGWTKEDQLVVALLFRNGLEMVYDPDELQIAITDEDHDLVAQGTLNASKIKVKPGNSRPWLIVFPPSAVKKRDANLHRWHVHVRE